MSPVFDRDSCSAFERCWMSMWWSRPGFFGVLSNTKYISLDRNSCKWSVVPFYASHSSTFCLSFQEERHGLHNKHWVDFKWARYASDFVHVLGNLQSAIINLFLAPSDCNKRSIIILYIYNYSRACWNVNTLGFTWFRRADICFQIIWEILN